MDAVTARVTTGSHRQAPLPIRVAVPALARCALEVLRLLARHRLRLPRQRVGTRLRFGDDSSARIYRETVVDGRSARNPCALIVRFRLRGVRGIGHAVFRAESLANTPLFAGFPGFVAKWWLAADEHGVYRGLYEWDGAERAEFYARALWRVLALVSVPGSVGYVLLDGRHRDDLLPPVAGSTAPPPADDRWWCPVAVV